MNISLDSTETQRWEIIKNNNVSFDFWTFQHSRAVEPLSVKHILWMFNLKFVH